MMLTANSLTSRNTSLGFELGEGKALSDILSRRKEVTEGAFSTEAVAALGRSLDVKMPVTFALDDLLNHGAALETTLARLIAAFA
jgi:glycerol-3-phosphate dehydrogenase (NAD(P)+)